MAEWEEYGIKDDLGICAWYRCSVCDFMVSWHNKAVYDFCPNCGLTLTDKGREKWKMREARWDND